MKIINDTFSCGIRTVIAKPEGVCSQAIELKIFGDEILDVAFYGGCNGNLKGIAALVEGKEANEIIPLIEGITCGSKKTSCPDQLANALKLALAQ